MKKKYKFTFRSKKIQLILDKLLLIQLVKRIHGRYWGVFGLAILLVLLSICYAIARDSADWSVAISVFGTDTRTAPFFTAGLFFGGYGLWRWRNYLNRTTNNPGIITTLITLTIVGLFMVAFMPLGWTHTVETLHYIGFALAGISMVLTVLADFLLTKTKKSKNQKKWQITRLISISIILIGLIITLLSTNRMNNILNLALLGELLILIGYGLWIITKTYQGEGRKTGVSKLLNKLVIIK
jgi:peptidoglycan/LPS O-acetylase OafA/YrhL